MCNKFLFMWYFPRLVSNLVHSDPCSKLRIFPDYWFLLLLFHQSLSHFIQSMLMVFLPFFFFNFLKNLYRWDRFFELMYNEFFYLCYIFPKLILYSLISKLPLTLNFSSFSNSLLFYTILEVGEGGREGGG